MLVKSVSVGPFKSIDQQQNVEIDEDVTVLVGMNEAGKTVFLQSLRKANDALGVAKFDVVEDYPRKALNAYQKTHATKPSPAITIHYQLNDDEASTLSSVLKVSVPPGFSFSITTNYANGRVTGIHIDERAAVAALAGTTGISSDTRKAIKGSATLRAAEKALGSVTRTPTDDELLTSLTQRNKKATAADWPSTIEYEASIWLLSRLPKFAFFGDYEVLPGKMNLTSLEKRKTSGQELNAAERGVLALLRMADVTLDEVAKMIPAFQN